VEQELHRNQGLGIAGALMRAWGVTDVNREAHVSSASIVMPAVPSTIELLVRCTSNYPSAPCNAELQGSLSRVFSSAAPVSLAFEHRRRSPAAMPRALCWSAAGKPVSACRPGNPRAMPDCISTAPQRVRRQCEKRLAAQRSSSTLRAACTARSDNGAEILHGDDLEVRVLTGVNVVASDMAAKCCRLAFREPLLAPLAAGRL